MKNFDKEFFESNVREIVATVSRSTNTHYEVAHAERDDVLLVSTKEAKDIAVVAAELSERDFIVEYPQFNLLLTSNFVRVKANPYPTSEHFEITRIPIGFAQALELVKSSNFGVVESLSKDGKKHITVVGTSKTDHDDLSELAHLLSAGGIHIVYYGVGEFFEFEDENSLDAEATEIAAVAV